MAKSVEHVNMFDFTGGQKNSQSGGSSSSSKQPQQPPQKPPQMPDTTATAGANPSEQGGFSQVTRRRKGKKKKRANASPAQTQRDPRDRPRERRRRKETPQQSKRQPASSQPSYHNNSGGGDDDIPNDATGVERAMCISWTHSPHKPSEIITAMREVVAGGGNGLNPNEILKRLNQKEQGPPPTANMEAVNDQQAEEVQEPQEPVDEQDDEQDEVDDDVPVLDVAPPQDDIEPEVAPPAQVVAPEVVVQPVVAPEYEAPAQRATGTQKPADIYPDYGGYDSTPSPPQQQQPAAVQPQPAAVQPQPVQPQPIQPQQQQPPAAVRQQQHSQRQAPNPRPTQPKVAQQQPQQIKNTNRVRQTPPQHQRQPAPVAGSQRRSAASGGGYASQAQRQTAGGHTPQQQQTDVPTGKKGRRQRRNKKKPHQQPQQTQQQQQASQPRSQAQTRATSSQAPRSQTGENARERDSLSSELMSWVPGAQNSNKMLDSWCDRLRNSLKKSGSFFLAFYEAHAIESIVRKILTSKVHPTRFPQMRIVKLFGYCLYGTDPYHDWLLQSLRDICLQLDGCTSRDVLIEQTVNLISYLRVPPENAEATHLIRHFQNPQLDPNQGEYEEWRKAWDDSQISFNAYRNSYTHLSSLQKDLSHYAPTESLHQAFRDIHNGLKKMIQRVVEHIKHQQSVLDRTKRDEDAWNMRNHQTIVPLSSRINSIIQRLDDLRASKQQKELELQKINLEINELEGKKNGLEGDYQQKMLDLGDEKAEIESEETQVSRAIQTQQNNHRCTQDISEFVRHCEDKLYKQASLKIEEFTRPREECWREYLDATYMHFMQLVQLREQRKKRYAEMDEILGKLRRQLGGAGASVREIQLSMDQDLAEMNSINREVAEIVDHVLQLVSPQSEIFQNFLTRLDDISRVLNLAKLLQYQRKRVHTQPITPQTATAVSPVQPPEAQPQVQSQPVAQTPQQMPAVAVAANGHVPQHQMSPQKAPQPTPQVVISPSFQQSPPPSQQQTFHAQQPQEVQQKIDDVVPTSSSQAISQSSPDAVTEPQPQPSSGSGVSEIQTSATQTPVSTTQTTTAIQAQVQPQPNEPQQPQQEFIEEKMTVVEQEETTATPTVDQQEEADEVVEQVNLEEFPDLGQPQQKVQVVSRGAWGAGAPKMRTQRKHGSRGINGRPRRKMNKLA